MDKFKIGNLVDYFLKVNKDGKSYKDLSAEDKVTLAILSVFDTKGKTVKTSKYTYERPDRAISEEEFTLTKDEYEKKAEQIRKAIKKETGKDFSKLNIPTYEQLKEMMKDDKKIDLKELQTFAQKGVIQHTTDEKPKFHGLPPKAKTNEVTPAKMEGFIAEIASYDTQYAIIEKFQKMPENEYKTFVDNLFKVPSDVETTIKDFQPDTNVAYNVPETGEQCNEHGQKIYRVNNEAGVYECYTYASKNDKKFDSMMRYNANGYKTEYWKATGKTTDKDGNTHPVYTVYSLDENEKVVKISTIPEQEQSQEVKDFNDYHLYKKYEKYYDTVFPETKYDKND